MAAGTGSAEGGEEPPPLAGGIAAATLLTFRQTPPQDSGFPKHFNNMKSMGVGERSSFFQIGPRFGLMYPLSVDACGVTLRSENLGGARDSSLEFGLGQGKL